MNIKFSLGNGQTLEGNVELSLAPFTDKIPITLTQPWDDFPIGTQLDITETDILPSPVEYSEDVEINEELELDLIVNGISVKDEESNNKYNDKWKFLESIKQSIGSLKPSFCFE